jgi:aminopeptidase-like protein
VRKTCNKYRFRCRLRFENVNEEEEKERNEKKIQQVKLEVVWICVGKWDGEQEVKSKKEGNFVDNWSKLRENLVKIHGNLRRNFGNLKI